MAQLTAELKQLHIEYIGSRLDVTGERGNWDVCLGIQLKGRERSQNCSVRLKKGRGAFNHINLRDRARSLRDHIQFALAQDEAPIYVRVLLHENEVSEQYAAEHQEMFPLFPKRREAHLPFRSSEFQTHWNLPHTASILMPRWSWLQGDKHG